MKRLLLVGALLLTATAYLGAQEEKKESNEPAAGWKWANFALLAVGLGYLVAKSLPPVFRSRTAEIQKGIAEAQEIKKNAEKRASDVEAKTKSLGADIERFRAESKIEMQQEGERIRQETAAQIARLEQKAEQEIEAAGKTARRELKNYAARLALDLAEQRVRTRLDAATEQSMIDGYIQDLERQNPQNTESKS
jgi:F-type H+-transporting ATPase subunit b